MPVLFIVGEQDELIPPAHMHQLHQLFLSNNNTNNTNENSGGDYRLVSIDEGRHMNTWIVGKRKYWQAVLQFIHQQ